MIETLAFVLFVFIALWFVRKLYNAATETYKEATDGIRDVRKKGHEWCTQVEDTFKDPVRREEIKTAAGSFLAEVLAEGVGRGIEAAHRRITEREIPSKDTTLARLHQDHPNN